MKDLLFVFLGGGLGSLFRFFIAKLINLNFPFGTLLVNVLGAFILGITFAFFEKQFISRPLQLLIVVGFCGGFTTWSTFAFENFNMLRQGNIFYFFIYTSASFLLSIAVILLAYKLVKG